MPLLTDMLTLSDFEERAAAVLPSATLAYFRSGADDEITVADNRTAFDRYVFIPRVMVDPTNIRLEVQILDQRFGLPIGFAPTAMQRLAHPDGEISTAKSAFQKDLLMVATTLSTTSLETIAANAGNDGTKLWFQLYLYKNRDTTVNLIRRVERAGYKALVLTVDAPVFGRRLADCRNRFHLPSNLKLPNFEGLKASDLPLTDGGSNGRNSELCNNVSEFLDSTPTWESLDWLKNVTKLPIFIKGIMSPDDAELAITHGASGVIVSNHGGRQLDGVPATIEVLPLIAKQVANRVPVLMDGGVRRGADILKALALGAKMVLLGRPVLYGLALAGQEGVNRVVEILKEELIRAMALSGTSDVRTVTRNLVVHRRTLENQF